MIWDGKPLTSMKKGIAGSYNRKSRDLEWETADQYEKRIVGSRQPETRAQSPKSNWSIGGSPLSKNNTKKNKYFLFVIHIFSQQQQVPL